MTSQHYSNSSLSAIQTADLRPAKTEVPCTAGNYKVKVVQYKLEIKPANPAKQTPEKALDIEKTKLCIKNMVSIRCKIVLKAILQELHLEYSTIELGEVEIIGKLSSEKHAQLKAELLKYGFELLEDKKDVLVQKMKQIIIEMVHYSDELPKLKLSYYLSEKLHHDYTYLSNLFSAVKGESVQHFLIKHKIERVKEMMIYDRLSLTEIAWRQHYSSVAHLSTQFKQITGLSPSEFKHMKDKNLKSLDEL